MKIEIRFSSGAAALFEGEREDFDLFQRVLHDKQLNAIATPTTAQGEQSPNGDAAAINGDLSPQGLQARLDRASAQTDVERAAVLAHAAVEGGEEGLTTALADRWYSELGLPKPANWRATFSNARAAGLLHSSKRGVWRPTTAGENFAVHGLRRSSSRRLSRRGPEDEGE